MSNIRTSFLSPQSLQGIKSNPQAVKAINEAAKQKGSEIVFTDKNNQTQTVTLDQYLNNPGLSKFQGAKSATLTLEVEGKTLLIDIEDLNQDNLLKAVSNALTKLQGKGSKHTAQFKKSAAPIFDSLKPKKTTESEGIDQATRQSLRKQPQAKTIGSSTSNFLDILNPLDSPGDSIDIKLEASAAVKIWGPIGIEASGNAGINVSVDDDGLFYVKFTANADVGVTASGGVKGAKVKGKAAAGAGVGVVYRFKNAAQVNQFLLQKFNQALPASVKDKFLPNLEKNSQNVNVKPTEINSVYVKVEGEVEIGKLKVSASFEHRDIERTFFAPSGVPIVSDDYNQTTQVNIELGDNVKLSGSYSKFRVEKDNIPENTGTYKALEGSITFTFSKEQISKFREGGADHIRAHISNAAKTLGLTGNAKEKFIQAAIAKAADGIKAAEGTSKVTKGLTIGIAIQAQWEDTADGGSGELQYFRVGGTVSVEASKSVSIGVVEGSIKGSATATDVTDVIIGTKDETYLAGLYFNNRPQYEIAKAKLGGDNTLVGPEGKEKTLKSWEAEWAEESKTRVSGTQVDMSLNALGKAEQLYSFVSKNFSTLDSNNDGFIYTDEIKSALKNKAFQSPEDQAALKLLLQEIGNIEELVDDEWGDENDGVTLKDIKKYIEIARQ